MVGANVRAPWVLKIELAADYAVLFATQQLVYLCRYIRQGGGPVGRTSGCGAIQPASVSDRLTALRPTNLF